MMKSGYSTITIGEIAEVRGGKRLPKGKRVQDEPTGHPYIRVVDFRNDGLDRSSIKYIDDESYVAIRRYIITSEDVYVSIAGTIGLVGIVPNELSGANLTENASKICEIDSSVDRRFLMYYLRSPLGQSQILSRIVGTSQAKLALFRIKEIEMLKSPLPVQRKIAAILSAYDDLIENNTRRIQVLEEMAQAIYREWFVHFRFPGHQRVKLVDSELGPVPEGWEARRLSSVAAINELSIKKGQAPERIRYINISSVSRGEVLVVEALAFSDAPGRARRIVKHGDIIWSAVRPNLKAYTLILDPDSNLIVSTGFAVISPKKVPYSYLYEALTTEEFVGYLVNHTRGAAYPAVNTEDFENAQILVPTTEVLEAFHNVADNPFMLRRNLSEKNVYLRQTRDLLLPRLISGEVDVSELDIKAEAVEP